MPSQPVPGKVTPEPPLISVVVPVYGVWDYLSECLDSLLGHPARSAASAPPIEVIAVEDASPDGSGDLLDARSELDQRLSVVHLTGNAGPGNARNVGLSRATGSYVWFVDGDDLLPPGALSAVAERLLADWPDVLLIDYEERYPGGRTAPNPGRRLLRAAPSGTFWLTDAPKLVDLTMTSWSKVFRREFLAGLDEPFRAGIHEDITVTCAALLTGRISVLDRVCYCYRRSRPGSFMATTSSEHWGVFSAYEEVLERMRKLRESGDSVSTPAVQAAVFERAIWHYSTVLEGGNRGVGRFGGTGLVPRGERRRFFERMHADFLRYRPADYVLPGGARGIKFRLIERGSYRAYALLEPANRVRVLGARLMHHADR